MPSRTKGSHNENNRLSPLRLLHPRRADAHHGFGTFDMTEARDASCQPDG
jgi:hypothetical protein